MLISDMLYISLSQIKNIIAIILGEHAYRGAQIRCSQRASLAPAVPRAQSGLVSVGADAGPSVGRGLTAQRTYRQGRRFCRSGGDGAGGVLETGMAISTSS